MWRGCMQLVIEVEVVEVEVEVVEVAEVEVEVVVGWEEGRETVRWVAISPREMRCSC